MGGKNSYESIKKYEDKAYDKVLVRMPKGRKIEIQAHAEAQGQSVNGFINTAIDAQMGNPSVNPVEVPMTHGGAGVVSLPSDTLKTAQEAAQSAGETVLRFIERAVDTQAKRDKTSLALGISPATGGKLEKEA